MVKKGDLIKEECVCCLKIEWKNFKFKDLAILIIGNEKMNVFICDECKKELFNLPKKEWVSYLFEKQKKINKMFAGKKISIT